MRIDNNKARFLKKYEQRLKKVLLVGFIAGIVICFLLGSIVSRIRIGGLEKKYKEQIAELEKKNEQLSNESQDGGTGEKAASGADTLSSAEDGWSLVLILSLIHI